MVQTFDELHKLTKDNVDVAVKSFNVASKGAQAIALEVADYSKKAFDAGTATTEKLFGAKSVEKAVEIQNDYLRSAYDGYVSQVTKLGEMYADLAWEAYKPYEAILAKVSPAK
jgi:hypothetical protein